MRITAYTGNQVTHIEADRIIIEDTPKSPKNCSHWTDESGYPICRHQPGKPALCSREEIPENCPMKNTTTATSNTSNAKCRE